MASSPALPPPSCRLNHRDETVSAIVLRKLPTEVFADILEYLVELSSSSSFSILRLWRSLCSPTRSELGRWIHSGLQTMLLRHVEADFQPTEAPPAATSTTPSSVACSSTRWDSSVGFTWEPESWTKPTLRMALIYLKDFADSSRYQQSDDKPSGDALDEEPSTSISSGRIGPDTIVAGFRALRHRTAIIADALDSKALGLLAVAFPALSMLDLSNCRRIDDEALERFFTLRSQRSYVAPITVLVLTGTSASLNFFKTYSACATEKGPDVGGAPAHHQVFGDDKTRTLCLNSLVWSSVRFQATSAEADPLAQFLQGPHAGPNLLRLRLYGPTSAAVFGSLQGHCSNLIELAVTGLTATESRFSELFQHMPHLQRFYVNSNASLTTEDMLTLSVSCRKLTHLALVACLRVADIGVLAVARQCPNIEMMDISQMKGFTPTFFDTFFCSFLPAGSAGAALPPQLKYLNLSSNVISSTAVAGPDSPLRQFIRSTSPNLKCLVLPKRLEIPEVDVLRREYPHLLLTCIQRLQAEEFLRMFHHPKLF